MDASERSGCSIFRLDRRENGARCYNSNHIDWRIRAYCSTYDEDRNRTFSIPGYRLSEAPGEHDARCRVSSTTTTCPSGFAKNANEVCVSPTGEKQENAGLPQCPKGNPCDPASGNKFQTEVDYRGQVEFVRYYNSYQFYPKLRKMIGPLGLRYALTQDQIFKFD